MIDKVGYLTNPIFLQDRKADYEAYDVAAKFEVVPDNEEFYGIGNICLDTVVNPTDKSVHFQDNSSFVAFYQSIPACLLMYRIACLFEGSINMYGRKGYKQVWTCTLIHRETGQKVEFGDCKGAAFFWINAMSVNDMPSSFQTALQALLTILVSDTCPHPYDGVVAGSVA